jgi:hypothetical protein
MNCEYCKIDFKPFKTTQKYCSTNCRVKAFNVQKNAQTTQNLTNELTDNNEQMNEQINAKKTIDETIERILMERQQVFETKLKQQETEYNNKLLELRLIDLERKVLEMEKENNKETGFGIGMPEVINAAMTYFATKSTQTESK